MQLSLSFAVVETILNTLCPRWDRCKDVRAELGPKQHWPGGFNETMTCLRCQRVIGERSTRDGSR